MMEIEKYCKLLGVKPGDSAEIVKAAFREKIKECHPDRGGDSEKTKLLIEAYEKLKDGVPVNHNQKTSRKIKNDYTNKEIFKDFLSRIFAHDPHILNIINEILNQYGLDEIEISVKTKRYYKQNEEIHSDEAWNDFERAERAFHNVMQKFNSQKGRPIKYRSLELIKNLSQVQIIYRSVMVKHPSFTFKCKQRLEQIQELMQHAKMTL
ncbi:MAG: hypothetical protein KatS3mg129_1056 [Leptospiraceae bacterium]|nr:MAG: hypothetical protein KatS3mg129_1056 [Leptospiraceae bacterium]